MLHKLKIRPQYLKNLISGNKRAEVRENDRDYQKGDVIEFEIPDTWSGPLPLPYFKITHVHSGLGLKEGYVVLSVIKKQSSDVERDET